LAALSALLGGILEGGCQPAAQPIGPPDSSAIGTYELAFCRRSCASDDSASVRIRGILVLDSVKVAVPDSQAEYFAVANAGSWATDLLGHNPGAACFILHEPGRPTRNSHGLPVIRGVPAVALTNWRYDADSGLILELYRSPDAAFQDGRSN